MRELKIALAVVSIIIVLIFATLFLIGYFKPKGAGLLVNTTPSASVFIDGVEAGKSPYKATLEPKDVVLRLVPESTGAPLAVFETRLTLNPGVETVVNREFGATEADSSGEIISFEKADKDETSLSVVSIPDAAQISIDGQIRGFAPYKTSSILPGEHQVVISAPGYNQKILQVKTVQKYKLVVIVKLSINLEEQVKKEESFNPTQDKEEEKVYVEISTTPTGFLRVREEASTSSAEIGQVKPGEKYELVEEAEGWYKITFKEGVSPEQASGEQSRTSPSGWISAQYAEKVEETSPSPSPSPSPTASPKAT